MVVARVEARWRLGLGGEETGAAGAPGPPGTSLGNLWKTLEHKGPEATSPTIHPIGEHWGTVETHGVRGRQGHQEFHWGTLGENAGHRGAEVEGRGGFDVHFLT